MRDICIDELSSFIPSNWDWEGDVGSYICGYSNVSRGRRALPPLYSSPPARLRGFSRTIVCGVGYRICLLPDFTSMNLARKEGIRTSKCRKQGQEEVTYRIPHTEYFRRSPNRSALLIYLALFSLSFSLSGLVKNPVFIFNKIYLFLACVTQLIFKGFDIFFTQFHFFLRYQLISSAQHHITATISHSVTTALPIPSLRPFPLSRNVFLLGPHAGQIKVLCCFMR